MRNLLTLLLISITSTTALAAGPGISNDFAGKRVLYIGIDGVRPDSLQAANTPAIDALAANGIITYNAFSGGVLGTPTQQATSSGPGWSTLLTGVWTDKHGVTSNNFSGSNFGNYPHFMRRIKENHPTSHLSSVIHWTPIDTNIVEDSKLAGVDFLSYRKDVGTDALVASEAINDISNSNPDVVFLHFDDVDHAGHASGYSATNTTYTDSIAGVDTLVGNVVAAVQARPQYAQEDWLIIVSTDHGGINTGHGGQSLDERTIFVLVSGGNTPNGVVSNATSPQTVCVPTALYHLGIPLEPAWDINPETFGIIRPTLAIQGAGKHAILNWTIPSGGVANLTGFEILRDGISIATLPITARNYTDSPTFPAGTPTSFSYEIRFTGSSEPSLTKDITLGTTAGGTSGDVISDLEMHLAFDNSTLDSTANNHDATAVGGTMYQPGIKGNAATIGNGKYFTVPQTGGLLFGANQDFTVGFWVKADTQWSSDPSFISNKNWNSGGNQGWIVAAQGNGPAWQWNLKGNVAGRLDFDNGGTVRDGDWHHILVSHDRDGNATFYQDGTLISTTSIAGAGTTDTAFPIAIGADGNLGNQFNQDLLMDEVKVWRRALTADDAAKEGSIQNPLYTEWAKNNFTVAELNDPLKSGGNADLDGDGMKNFVEFALGTDPNKTNHGYPVTITPDGDNFLITWPQRNGGSGDIGIDYKIEDITYQLEYSLDLTSNSWNSGSSLIVEHSAPEYLAEGWHTAKATLVNPPATAVNKGFFRLNLTQE